MARLTITHLAKDGDTTPIYISDIYAELKYGTPISTDRTPDQISAMTSLVGLVATLQVSCAVVYTDNEISAAAQGMFANVSADLIYGSGQDGIAVFDGVNTFSFASLVGSVYTLTRDIFIANGSTCESGITIYTAGFKGFCNGKFWNKLGGIIHNDGNAAALGTAGADSAIGTTGQGMAGGNGQANDVGLPGSDQINTISDASAAGGDGGAGGISDGGTGGTYVNNAAFGGANYLTPMLTGCLFSQNSLNDVQLKLIGGGAGGGGGGSDSLTVTGGGGGGGGGVLIWHAYELVNDGTIRAGGGAGADASGTGGNGGGGGGGGGGTILSLSRNRLGSGLYVVDGGTGGAAIGTGVSGTDGSLGHKKLFLS